jgi:protein-S-isoprenylcysteine O-methyltransferase Ste14
MPALLVFATIVAWIVLDGRTQKRVAADRQRTAPTEADRGSAAFVQALSIAGLVLGLSARMWFPGADLPGSRGTWLAVGLPIAWAGIWLRVASISFLGRMFSPLVRIEDDHQVVDAGPYRFVRHPSYVGVLVLSVGLGLAMANVVALLAIPGLRLVGYVRRIRVEEEALSSALGERYAAYAQGRARLVPGIW